MPLSVWFYHALCDEGLHAIGIDARHAKPALSMAVNKTDANEAPNTEDGVVAALSQTASQCARMLV